MRHTIWITLAALSAACSSAPTVGRSEVPPSVVRPEARRQAAATQTTDETATRAWLQQQVERTGRQTGGQTAAVSPTDEAATNQWLEQEAERARTQNPERRPEPIYQEVERTVYVDRPYYADRGYYGGHSDYGYGGYSGYGYDGYGEPVYTRYGTGGHHRSTFPVQTMVGAGIGAIIGHQSGHRDRGAAIGAGLGFLADLSRWHRY